MEQGGNMFYLIIGSVVFGGGAVVGAIGAAAKNDFMGALAVLLVMIGGLLMHSWQEKQGEYAYEPQVTEPDTS